MWFYINVVIYTIVLNVWLVLTKGKLYVANDRVYIGSYKNTPMEVVTMAHELNVGTINGLTMEQILDKMVEKKIGISGSGSSSGGTGGATQSGLLEGKIINGEVVRFDGMYWVVAHTDYVNKKAYLASNILVTSTKFGSNNVYKGSTLATVAAAFEANMSEEAKAIMLTETVNGVAGKVFAPTYDQMNGGWSYFSTQANRICKLNGVDTNYWTSSPSSSSSVYFVVAVGNLQP